MADRNVPGHTQLTLMPSRAYSTAATFASWMTAALVAQYGAACDQAVSPETDAVRTIDPALRGRITPTAALMPLTAPMTLTLNARSQSAVLRLWMRPLGESTPALLIRTSTPPNRSTASATRTPPARTRRRQQAASRPVRAAREARREARVERSLADVAEHQIGVRLPGELA